MKGLFFSNFSQVRNIYSIRHPDDTSYIAGGLNNNKNTATPQFRRHTEVITYTPKKTYGTFWKSGIKIITRNYKEIKIKIKLEIKIDFDIDIKVNIPVDSPTHLLIDESRIHIAKSTRDKHQLRDKTGKKRQ